MLVNNVRVFVPRSQATLRHGEDYTALVKTNVRLKMKQCEGRHIVGSIREVLAAENDAKREEFWANVEIGKQYTGVVKSLTNYGAFVDIGGVDARFISANCPGTASSIRPRSRASAIPSMCTSRISTPRTKKCLWAIRKPRTIPGRNSRSSHRQYHMPVVSITKSSGAFVRILPGIDGLVHISEISNERVEKVSDVLSVGQEVEVKLTDVDFEKKRISLSMKALLSGSEADGEDAE